MTLHVAGTHCSACKLLIEETLGEREDLFDVQVSLTDETVTFRTTRADSAAALATALTPLVRAHGYTLHAVRPVQAHNPREWWYAFGAVVLVVAAFFALDRIGLTSLITAGEATLATAFAVGLVASVSTCLAVVGGLVFSVSATYAQSGAGTRPQVLFHAGRLVGFLVLGGVLGYAGAAMQIGIYGSTLLGAAASIVMLLLGLHLLGVTRTVRALSLPSGLSARVTSAAKRAGPLTPPLIGAATFFLPCGFTQSMQVLALSSGSVVTGALTMLAFALGTLPVLSLLSFGSLNFAQSAFRGPFFKAAGMLVIIFALFNLHNALVMFGIIPPLIAL